MVSAGAQWLGWIGFGINIILANIIGHGLWTVFSKRNAIQWSARHFDQLFYALVWSIVFVFVERNLQLLGGILELYDFPFEVRWFLNNLFGIGFLALFLLRAWLVHFDFHSGVALFNLVSNPDLDDQQREHLQWFIDNKVNYGSPKYLTRFTITMTLILNLFMLGWSAISPVTFVYGMVFIYAIMIIISIGITRHIVLLDDNFFIRQEILLEFRIFATMFIIGGIIIIFGPPMGWNYASFFLIELSVICIFLMCFVATYWVLRKSQDVGLDNDRGPVITINLPKGAPRLSIALRDRKATTEFIKHLVNEVSVENIFFLSDVMAYKKAFVKTGKLDQINGFECSVGTQLARLMFRRTFTHYAWAISKTYVDGSSSLYVTAITSDTRNSTTEDLEEKDPNDEKKKDGTQQEVFQSLQQEFDRAAEEVYNALKQSYARFAYTDQFKRIQFPQQRMAKQLSSIANTGTKR